MKGHWIWLLPVAAALIIHFAAGPQVPPVPGLGPMPASWWWVTACIAVATALGAFRLARALGVEGALVPAALVIGATGVVGALAARGLDGPSGAGFGMESLALCLLIWCYEAVVRAHAIRAGVLLGAAGLAHPLALAHGLPIVAVATLCQGEARGRRLGLTVGVALAAGAPAAVQLVAGAVDIVRMDALAARRLIEEGYRFRYPSSYQLQGLLGKEGIARIVVLLAGVGATVALLGRGRDGAARALGGLIAGHAILTGLGVLSYTRRVPGPWNRSATAYALDLTLTTPLLPLLCGIALLAALEARVVGGKAGITGPRVLRLALWAAAATILVMVDWTPTHLVAAALGVMVLAAGRFARWLQPAALALAALAAAVATARGARYRGADTPVERADAELYSWARDTPKQTSFIVPPLARGFRYHTRKAVYVDYDLLPPASPQAMRSWRDRLELVCRPDRRIATVPAWRRPYAMERAYARANTPARAAELLQQLGGDYLVWDARGLEIPPHVPVDRPDDSRVVTAFRNERYIVYALAEGRSRGTP